MLSHPLLVRRMLGAIIVVWDSAQAGNADYDKHTVHVPSAALPWVNFALGTSETFGRGEGNYPNPNIGLGEHVPTQI